MGPKSPNPLTWGYVTGIPNPSSRVSSEAVSPALPQGLRRVGVGKPESVEGFDARDVRWQTWVKPQPSVG